MSFRFPARAAVAPTPAALRFGSEQGARRGLPPAAVALAAIGIDALGVALLAGIAGVLSAGRPSTTLLTAAFIGVLHVGVGLARRDYALGVLLEPRRLSRRAAGAWCLAGALAVAAEGLAGGPRGATLLLVGLGLPGIPALRGLAGRCTRRWALAGRVALRRLMLVGEEAAVEAALRTGGFAAQGRRPIAGVALREAPATLAEDLALAVATARLRGPDEVVLLLPWDGPVLRQALTAFRGVPAAIHLGPAPPGSGAALPWLRLVEPPMTGVDRIVKRLLDVTLAAAGLLALAPLLLLIAAAVRLDSPGPALFRQRRIGFNQRPFRIVKFRSMTTLDDGRAIRQATAGDARVTRVGRWLRLTSADELPQLLNVLAGDMSLVGPRPHAIAHDQAFAVAHGLYARRHTVRPGITGWAQVNGFRGETDTAEKVAGRVRHDADYVDNWSLWLDIVILARTVLSRRTFQNAC